MKRPAQKKRRIAEGKKKIPIPEKTGGTRRVLPGKGKRRRKPPAGPTPGAEAPPTRSDADRCAHIGGLRPVEKPGVFPYSHSGERKYCCFFICFAQKGKSETRKNRGVFLTSAEQGKKRVCSDHFSRRRRSCPVRAQMLIL